VRIFTHALLLLTFAMPAVVQAQPIDDRLRVHAEAGFGRMLSTHQTTRLAYDWFVQTTLRGGIVLTGPLSVQVSAGYSHFFSGAGAGSVTSLTGGLRFEKYLWRGHLFADANVGLGLTGSNALSRATFDLGAGYEFPFERVIAVGPFVRYSQLISSDDDLDFDARYFSVGVSVGLHREASNTDDRDRDGVPDVEDVCPDVARGPNGDRTRLGCSLEDNDADGISNANDMCPDVPRGTNGDPGRYGCPADDRDQDGIRDTSDRCPDESQGTSPDPVRLGCPDGDADQDGVSNLRDRCRTEPAGPHPDPSRAGCPLPDRDNDTIVDALDHCPDVVGSPSQNPSRNGCPGLIQIDTDTGRLVLNQPVFFAPRRDVILPRSYPVLDALRDALAATPSIRHVVIEGHTDSAGRREANVLLSEQRAQSVMRWLVEHEIAASRLAAEGLGPDRPIQPNTTARGRAANRRVEFVIR
jgi:outer membrane protein OmpA-like peptidoglycan-associated protein